MKIKVNDGEVDVPDSLSVTALLAHRQVKMPDMVSVELNGTILDRKSFDNMLVKEGDKLEFLYFMGGGQ